MLECLYKHSQKVDRAIFTVVMGDSIKDIFSLTSDPLVNYGKKVGADVFAYKNDPAWEAFEESGGRVMVSGYAEDLLSNPSTQELTKLLTEGKFTARFLLKDYDQVLYVDADVLILKEAEDIFSLVPKTHLGIYEEFNGANLLGIREYISAYNKVVESEGGVPLKDWNQRCFNSGVMLCSKDTDIFDPPVKHMCLLFQDQDYINWKIAESKVPIFPLPQKFNMMALAYPYEKIKGASFLHYAGSMAREMRFFYIESHKILLEEEGLL